MTDTPPLLYLTGETENKTVHVQINNVVFKPMCSKERDEGGGGGGGGEGEGWCAM